MQHWKRPWTTIAVFLLFLVLKHGTAAGEGFGQTSGGSGEPVVYVTNLNDSGPGSLRAALSGGNRRVVFAVAGGIALASEVSVRGPHVTIDGFSAPPPGITLHNYGLGVLTPPAALADGRIDSSDLTVQTTATVGFSP